MEEKVLIKGQFKKNVSGIILNIVAIFLYFNWIWTSLVGSVFLFSTVLIPILELLNLILMVVILVLSVVKLVFYCTTDKQELVITDTRVYGKMSKGVGCKYVFDVPIEQVTNIKNHGRATYNAIEVTIDKTVIRGLCCTNRDEVVAVFKNRFSQAEEAAVTK